MVPYGIGSSNFDCSANCFNFSFDFLGFTLGNLLLDSLWSAINNGLYLFQIQISNILHQLDDLHFGSTRPHKDYIEFFFALGCWLYDRHRGLLKQI